MVNPIQDKNIILGVTGSIAAYKAAELASYLTQQGANVEVILTSSALKFISALTFQSVSGQKVFTDDDLWGGQAHVVHVGLGHTANLLVVAPASANTMAKLAHGIGDNLLCLAALAAACPLVIAPAMDAEMWKSEVTQANVEILRSRGVEFIGPNEGHLASGLVGPGRMEEPKEILGRIRWILSRDGPLRGKRVVVTAGGTQEPIDPVRMITNRSSGKQGYAIAQSALDAGAEVVLISTPVNIPAPSGARLVQVQTASEMYAAVMTESIDSYALVMAAAVADFRPTHIFPQKIKKEGDIPRIELERTIDILSMVSKQKIEKGFPLRTVGFAAESQNVLKNAQKKVKAKNLDLIIANDIKTGDAGFGVDTNRVIFVFPNGKNEELPLMTKQEVADALVQKIISWV